jgi:poly-gamma-glutamate synthesis protein (capsule biosynthesis protein)
MLGRNVAERLAQTGPDGLFAHDLVDVAHEADLFVLNLECAISDRGARWPDPHKPYFFRAPPRAVESLCQLGVGCVTLANNHALDYGPLALLDTLDHLRRTGIATVGAGRDVSDARAPVVLAAGDVRVGIVGVTDHPGDYAAGPDRPGVAHVDLRGGTPAWLQETVGRLDADVVLVSPHWGPNLVDAPLPHVRVAASELLAAGATLVAGHSAHVFHGVEGAVLYDLGDFIDDYAVEPDLRNDLGLLWLVTFDGSAPVRLEALPLAIDRCRTRLADGAEAAWIAARFGRACRALGTEVAERDGRLVVEWDPPPSARRPERIASRHHG